MCSHSPRQMNLGNSSSCPGEQAGPVFRAIRGIHFTSDHAGYEAPSGPDEIQMGPRERHPGLSRTPAFPSVPRQDVRMHLVRLGRQRATARGRERRRLRVTGVRHVQGRRNGPGKRPSADLCAVPGPRGHGLLLCMSCPQRHTAGYAAGQGRIQSSSSEAELDVLPATYPSHIASTSGWCG